MRAPASVTSVKMLDFKFKKGSSFQIAAPHRPHVCSYHIEKTEHVLATLVIRHTLSLKDQFLPN